MSNLSSMYWAMKLYSGPFQISEAIETIIAPMIEYLCSAELKAALCFATPVLYRNSENSFHSRILYLSSTQAVAPNAAVM